MVKYRFATLLVILSFAMCLTAQTRLEQPQMFIGVQGGVTAATVSFSPTVNGTSSITDAVLLGGNGGVVFRYYGHRYCGWQAEINYMQRGWREKFTESSETGVYARRLQYVEMPFLMHIYFGSERCSGFVNLGPEIGYCIREGSSGIRQTTDTAQYAAINNKFDWGIAAGAGVYYRTRKAGVFQLEFRFDYSFGNFFNNSKKDYFDSSHAMDLSLNLGYLWELRPSRPSTKSRYSYLQPTR